MPRGRYGHHGPHQLLTGLLRVNLSLLFSPFFPCGDVVHLLAADVSFCLKERNTESLNIWSMSDVLMMTLKCIQRWDFLLSSKNNRIEFIIKGKLHIRQMKIIEPPRSEALIITPKNVGNLCDMNCLTMKAILFLIYL